MWNQDQPSPYGPLTTPSLKPDLLSIAQAHAWQSKRADPTNFIWLGTRYYNPRSGRFLSPDPVGHPACLDLYAYANGDPVNNIDPDGRYASYAYQSLGSFVIDSYSSLKSNFNQFSQGYKVGNSLSFEEMLSKNPWTINDSLSYGMGESYGRMEASFRHTLALLSPERLEGMAIGELPFSGGGSRTLIKVGRNALTNTSLRTSLLGESQLVQKEFQLNRFHQAARNLSEDGQNNIRILRGWAKSKGWVKAPNSGGPEKWGTMQNGKFKWNLVIKQEPSMRPNLESGSNVPRFDARIKPGGEVYINPFTGKIGNEDVGKHVLLINFINN